MKKFIMYGAGNIGRGFIGQTFSDSGYKVGFVDIHKGDFRVAEGFERQEITNQIPREDQTAGTDEYDFFSHNAGPFCMEYRENGVGSSK